MSQSLSPSWWPGRGRLCLQRWVNCSIFCFYFQIPPNTHFLPSHIWLPSQEYPKNTVRGRVCLGLRLDWDLNSTKETSDIYVKPRLAIYPYKDTENSKSNNPNVFQVDCSRSYDRLVFFYVLHHHQVTIFINKEGLRYICISSILSGPVYFCMFKFVSLFSSFCCRVRRFVSDFCQSNKWHGSIGGR